MTKSEVGQREREIETQIQTQTDRQMYRTKNPKNSIKETIINKKMTS